MSDDEKCRTCRFMRSFQFQEKRDLADRWGECLKRAPVVSVVPEDHGRGVWPSVNEIYWCGDYEVKTDGGQEEETGVDAPGNVA